jgi:hypothetical protein
VPADLVVDASGRGQLTVSHLKSTGRPFQQTEIDIDIKYSTAVLDVPDDVSRDWKAVVMHNKAPNLSRRAVLLPIEGKRWLMTALGYRDDHPPTEWSQILCFLQHLTTRTIYDAVSKIRPKDNVVRFGLPASVWRHFERVPDFPDNLLPIGDAIARFNPAYGQGMTVAAKEATLLRRVLAAHASAPDPLSGLSRGFLSEAASFIETPWSMAALPDLAFPEVHGERPADLNRSLAFQHALMRLSLHDTEVQRLRSEVWHMLKPPSALRAHEFARRVEAEWLNPLRRERERELAYAIEPGSVGWPQLWQARLQRHHVLEQLLRESGAFVRRQAALIGFAHHPADQRAQVVEVAWPLLLVAAEHLGSDTR